MPSRSKISGSFRSIDSFASSSPRNPHCPRAPARLAEYAIRLKTGWPIVYVWSGFSDLPHDAVRAQQLSQLDSAQIVFDVAPGVAAGLLGHSIEQQREHREGDVRVDAMRGPVCVNI